MAKENKEKVILEAESLEEYVERNGNVWKRMSPDCSITTGFITKIDFLYTQAGGIHYTFAMKVPILSSFDDNLENEVFYDDVKDFFEVKGFVSCAYSSVPETTRHLISDGNFVTVCHQSYALVPAKKSKQGPQEVGLVKKFALNIMEATNEPEEYLFSLVGTKNRKERKKKVREGWSKKFSNF